MPCESCGKHMEFIGTDQEGAQRFACRQLTCVARYQSVHRWWELGIDFHMEVVE